MAEVSNSPNTKFRNIIKLVSTIISWTIFVLLILCAIFLTYYFIATKIYMKKGSGYEPQISLYTIVSPSMTPNIKVYDVVIDTKVNKPEDIKVNDVITFNSDNPELKGSTITHRVISITQDENGNYFYQTKGDANLAEDSSLVPYNQIVGRVALKIPQLGRVQFFLASSFGWLIAVVIPALYIIIKDILKVLKITGNEKKVLAATNDNKIQSMLPSDEDIPVIEEVIEPVYNDNHVEESQPVLNDNNVVVEDVFFNTDDGSNEELPSIDQNNIIANNYVDSDTDDDDLPSLKE